MQARMFIVAVDSRSCGNLKGGAWGVAAVLVHEC